MALLSALADWRLRNKPKNLAELTSFPSDLLRLTGDHCRRPDRESGFCALSMPNLSGSTCLCVRQTAGQAKERPGENAVYFGIFSQPMCYLKINQFRCTFKFY